MVTLFVNKCVFDIPDPAFCYYVAPVLLKLFPLGRNYNIPPFFLADDFFATITDHVEFGVVDVTYSLIGSKDVKSDWGLFKKVPESLFTLIYDFLGPLAISDVPPVEIGITGLCHRRNRK